MTSAELEIVLPVLLRFQRVEGPYRPLEELLARMVTAAQRRGLVECLARCEREASGVVGIAKGTLAGPLGYAADVDAG